MYDSHRSEPSSDKCSNLNFFLRFGHISPIGIVLQINLLAEWAYMSPEERFHSWMANYSSRVGY